MNNRLIAHFPLLTTTTMMCYHKAHVDVVFKCVPKILFQGLMIIAAFGLILLKMRKFRLPALCCKFLAVVT